MPIHPGTPEYEDAVTAMTAIVRSKAAEGALINYEKVSLALKEQGHPVHHRGGPMSQMLRDMCLHEAALGAPMLSTIVINTPISRGRPSQMFYDLARSYPFNRGADWTWEEERDRVFAYYASQK